MACRPRHQQRQPPPVLRPHCYTARQIGEPFRAAKTPARSSTSMASVFAGALVTRALQAEGVTHIFGLLGHELLAIYDSCIDAGITIIGTRNETAAAEMA